MKNYSIVMRGVNAILQGIIWIGSLIHFIPVPEPHKVTHFQSTLPYGERLG